MNRLWFIPALFLTFFWSAMAYSCPQELSSHTFECGIYNRYQSAKNELATDYDIDIEQLVTYRALRFISDFSWNSEYYENNKNVVDYKPRLVYTPIPTTWAFWERGDAYAQDYLERRINLTPTLEDIIQLHRNVMHELIVGVYSAKKKGAAPGKLRRGKTKPPRWEALCKKPWTTLTKDEVDLIKDFDLRAADGKPIVRKKGRVKKCKGVIVDGEQRYALKMEYLKSSRVPVEIQRLVNYMAREWPLVKAGQSELSPVDFVADMQRYFISIHPFGEGNGRTSRMLQDLLVKSFGLPYPPTGKLGNDVTTRKEKYRQMMKDEIEKTTQMLEGCLTEYREYYADSGFENISKDCRTTYYHDSEFYRKVQEFVQLPFFRAPSEGYFKKPQVKGPNDIFNEDVAQGEMDVYFEKYPDMKVKKTDNK